MKRQKIPEDVSKDVKRAKVQVGHKMCIKKRRVTKVQQNVIKKISATLCQTMEVEESCAIVKRRKVSMSLGPNKHYVPHVSLSKKKTATCHQTKVSRSHTRKIFRKSPKQMSAAVDKHVEENIDSVGKTSLETSRGGSQSANHEKMRSPKNLIPNKSVLGKIQGKRGRKTGKVSPSSSNTAVQNTSRRLSPTRSKRSEAVSTQHSKPNKNTMLLRSNEKTSSVLHSRRKSTLKMHPETFSKVHEGVCGASTHHSTQCNPSDAIHAHAADKCHSHSSDSFNEADTSQETNTSLIVQLSPIKLNLLARQTSSTSRTSSSESMVIDSNEHAEEMCIFSDIGCTCNAKLVDETKTARQKYGSQRKRVKSSELQSESYRHVWKSTSTHQKQSTLLLPRHCRSQEIKVRKGKSVRKTTTLLRPNKMYTSGCHERKKTDQQANVENDTGVVVVGPNKRCIPVLSKGKEETKSACSCKDLHTCHSQQKQSAVGGVNSTTKWVSTINTTKDNCAVNQKKTTSCTETLRTDDKPSSVKSAKRFSSPASTQMETESPLACKSPQVPTPKCQIIDEKEVQVTNTPESLTVEGKQTTSLIQNEVSVTLNKLCYESVTHRLQRDDNGYSESEASTLSVPQCGGTKRKYLRNRKVAETLTSLKSDSERELPRTRNIVFDSAGLRKTQNTAITSSTRCQSNINSTSAIEMEPRRNSLLQKTSLRTKNTNNDTAKGKSPTLTKKRNAKDLSERIQKDSCLKSPNTRVSDEHEHFIDSESRGVQIPPILQDQDNLKTVCQATLDYSPKIVMGLRPYARYRSNGGNNHLHYNSKHWLLVQGQIDSQEEQAHLLNAAPVCLKGKRKQIRKKKRGRKKLGLQQKENEENPNQSVPIVQDNVSTETLSCVPLEAHEASSVEPPKLAMRTSKDLLETTTDLTQEKKCHEKNVTSPTIQSGLQKDMNNLKDSFCEVDSGANDIEVEFEKDERPTPIKTSHETSRSESEAVTQTTSATNQVSREKGDNPNPIISQTQTLDEDSVTPERDSCLSPVNTEHETQTSDCKVVAEADGTLSLIISSSETPSPSPDVEVVSQSTLVQVYVPVQSGHGRSPPCIISPHHTESPNSDEGTLSDHESCSTYIISPRGSLNPDNKAVTQSTSGDGPIQRDINFPLETKNPDNRPKLETQGTDSEVQSDQEGTDLSQSRTSPGSEAVMQSIPVDIKTQASSIDIRLNKDEDVTIKERSLFETFNPVIEEQESPIPNCDTGIEAVDISGQLEQDDRPIQIVCDQESFISDSERGLGNDDISDQLEQDDRPIQIVCEHDSSGPDCETGIENDDISDQLEQDDRPIQIVCEDDTSSPDYEMEIENDDISDQLEQDDRPIQIVCEDDSSHPYCETGIENDDISDQLEQDDRPIQIVCEDESSSPDSEMGLEIVDISDQLEQDDRPIQIVSEQESPTSCKKTESVSDDVSAFSEQDFNPAFNTSQREIPQSDFDLGSQAVPYDASNSVVEPVGQSHNTPSQEKASVPAKKQCQDSGSANVPVFTEQDTCSDQTNFSYQQSTQSIGSEVKTGVTRRESPESGEQHDGETRTTSLAMTSRPSTLGMIQLNVNGAEHCELTLDKVSDTSVKDLELPLVQSDSTRGKDEVALQSPKSNAESLIDLSMQPCNNPVKELTSSSRPAEAKFIGEGDSDSVTVVIQPDSPSKNDSGNLFSTSEKSSCMSKSKAQENIQGEKTKPTLSEDANKSFNFKQLWNIKRVPKNKGQEITYFYERVDEEEGKAASHNDSDIGPEATRIPQKPQLMYEKDTCHREENCNEPTSISLDSPSLMMKENEEEASEELNSVQPASSLGNSDANRKPDGLSTQNEIRKVTESPVTFYQSQREIQSCLSKQTTRKLQRSRGCQFEKRISSLEFETFADSLQVSSEESSSFEKLPPDVSSDSSSSSCSVSFLHTSPEGQELTPMFEGSSPGEVSTTEINERSSAVELDSEMVETPFTTSLKGTLSEHVEMSEETTRVRKTKIWQNSLLASMTLRKKDEHFLFSRLGFKKSKQRKSQMSEQRKYMAIKREPSQIPGEDCVKSEPLFRTESQHQESRHQSNSIVPEITDQTCHQRNHMFTSTQTRQRLGKRNLTASKTLNSEDYIFPAKRIKRHQLSSTLLTGSVLTNNPGRSKFGISVPHHLLVPRKRGRPKKVPLQDPALSESSVVSGTTDQTQLLNHQAVGEENLTEISRQDDTEARGVHLNDSSVSLLSGQGKRGQTKTSYGHCSQSIETPVVKEKPSLLIPPDNHVDNPRFKLEQDACDQSLLPFEPQKKNYKRKILSQGNKDQSFDAATSTPRRRGRPKKNPPTSFMELHQLEKNSIIESKVRKPYTKKLWTSKVKRVYATKGKWSWKFQASDLHELKPKRKYCRKTNSLSGIQGNQQSQEFKPKRKYCRKMNSLSGNNSNQQGQEPKPKRKYCRKINSLSGLQGNQQSQEFKPKRKYCRKTNSLSGLQELKPKRKYCRKTNSLSGFQGNEQSQELKPKRKYCRKTNSLSGLQELKPKRKYCRKTNSISGLQGNQQSQEFKPKRKYCRKTNSLSVLQELKPKRKYCRKTNSLSGFQGNEQSQELKPKRKYCRKTNSLSVLQELKPKRKYCRKTNSLSGLQGNQQSQELKPKRKYCRKKNSLSVLQELKPKRKYCRKTNSLSGFQGNEQSQELKPKRKYCRKIYSLGGIKINQQSQELKPKRKYCRKINSLSGIKRNQQSEELKPKRKYCRKMNSLSGSNSNHQGEEPKPKRKYCRKMNSLSGSNSNQQGEEPKPKRKYCRKMNSLSGNNSNQQSQEPKPKRKYCRKTNSLIGIKRTLAVTKPLQLLHPLFNKKHRLGKLLKSKKQEVTHKKMGRPKKSSLIESQTLSPNINKNKFLEELASPKDMTFRPKKMGRPKKIPLSEVEAPSTPTDQLQSLQPQIIIGNSLVECVEPATRPKKMGRPKKIPLSEVAAPSTPTYQLKSLQPQIIIGNSLVECVEPATRPKKMGRPKKIPLSEVKAPSTSTYQLQSLQPQIIIGNSLVECVEPATRPKKMGRPKKIPPSEVKAPSTSTYQLQPLQPQIIKGSFLGECGGSTRPKKMGRPKKIPPSEVKAPSTPTDQLQSLQPQIIIGNSLGECVEPATRPKKMGRPKKIPLSEVAAPSTPTYQRQSLQPQIIKGSFLGECGGPTRPKKMGRPKKIPLSEVAAPSTPTDQLQSLQPQITKGSFLGECGGPTRPKKMGRPKKIPLSEVAAPSTPTDQLQSLQPQITKGSFLGECGGPTRPKKMGRPKKIPLSEVAAPSTPTDQLQSLQPQIIKGNSLGECVEPATRPKKMGRPKKLNTSVSGSKATLSITDQLQLTHKIQVLIPGYIGPAKDEEFILEEFCSLESLEEAVQSAATEWKPHRGNKISRKRKNTNSLSHHHLTTTSAANSRRAKRSSRSPEGSYWDCSVCTYRNKAEAFKCAMCDVRKGTSTRKPRLNAQLVAQQQAQQNLSPLIHVKTAKTTARSPAQRKPGTSKKPRPRLKNVDRSSAISTEVVVNNVPVIITEYKEKSHTRTTIDSDDASAERTNGNVNGL